MSAKDRRIVVALLAALAVSPATLNAAEEDGPKHLLRYKFAAGEVIRYHVEHAATFRTTIEGTSETARTRTTSVKAWKVIDVMPDGEIEFSHVVEEVQMRNELPERAPVVYDSQKDAEPPPGFEHAAAAVGQTLSIIRMTPAGKIVDRQIKHAQPGYREDTPMVIPLPAQPVAVGHQWNEPHQVTVNLPGGGKKKVDTRRHFKLTGVKNGIATIAVTFQLLTPVAPPVEAQLVQRLSSGKLRLDIKAGRVLSQQLDVDRRIVGFAGPTSSMHYRMRFTERLATEADEVAAKPKASAATK